MKRFAWTLAALILYVGGLYVMDLINAPIY